MDVVAEKYRFALWFSIEGDLRYLSHRDTLSLWRKALLRSQLEMRYSAGFNPHMRLSLPLPRSVGMASDRELLLFELTEPVAVEAVFEALSGQLPEGILVLEGDYVPLKQAALPAWAAYRIDLTPRCDVERLMGRIHLFLASQEVMIERAARGRHRQRQIDSRSQVTGMELQGRALQFRISIDADATVRVNELCDYLELELPDDIVEIRRVDVGYPEFSMANV